jgi:hypothetical protein
MLNVRITITINVFAKVLDDSYRKLYRRELGDNIKLINSDDGYL